VYPIRCLLSFDPLERLITSIYVSIFESIGFIATRLYRSPVLSTLCLATLFSLTDCGAYGPIFNCKTGCANPNEERDIFCVCQNNSNVTIPVETPGAGDPYLFRQTITGGCTGFQEEDYIFNPQASAVDVLIGFMVEDGTPYGHSDEGWYTVSPLATNVSSATDLGLKYSSPNCFDQDFFIKTWQFHASGTARLTNAKMSMALAMPDTSYDDAVALLRPTARERQKIMAARFHDDYNKTIARTAPKSANETSVSPSGILTSTALVKRLDCATLCHSGDSRCLRNLPPDTQKITALRDKILATKVNSNLPSTDILRIFGLNTDPCARGRTSVDGSAHVQNDGEICAYPLLLEKKDRKPVAALHIGHNMSGVAIVSSGGTSILFNKPMELPVLAFANDITEGDYGGIVLGISADSRGVYLNTNNACVSLLVAR
jgi:hypothetical protein